MWQRCAEMVNFVDVYIGSKYGSMIIAFGDFVDVEIGKKDLTVWMIWYHALI